MRHMEIMIIFAAENDLTQMILCLKQTAQTYTEWLHRYCLQLSATPSVLLASRRLRRIRRMAASSVYVTKRKDSM
jgi:hypothetical protein